MATGNVELVNLPDGSRVTLNQHASLSYPNQFTSDSREVELSGDAFFDIEKNTQVPFMIKTDKLIIKVLGTSFYVNAKENAPTIAVVVSSGKVLIEAGKTKNIIIEKGEKGIFDKTTKVLVKTQNTDPNFISWKTMSLVFDDMPLGDVVKKINETYHTNIIFDNPDPEKCLLSATFENQSLETILEGSGKNLRTLA